MSASVTANRIYARTPHGMTGQGRIAAEDVKGLAPDLLLLKGLKPITKTQTASGLAIPHGGMAAINDVVGAENRSHPVRACACFEVVMLPASTTKGNPLGLIAGDVVGVYNSLVDPLLGNELAIAPIDAVQFVLEWAARPEAPSPRPRRQQRALTAATWDGLEPSSRVAVSFEDVRGFEPNMLVSLTRRDSSQVERVVRVAERPAFERGHSGTVTFVNDVYGAGKLASTSVATGDVFTVCERYDADGFPVSQVGETGVGQVFADLVVKGL